MTSPIAAPAVPAATSQPSDVMLAMLGASTHEVFETMVFAALDAKAPVRGGVSTGPCGVLGMIPFAGDCSGSVSFYTSEDAAVKITAAIMGMAPAEVHDEMPDGIGEVTNMIAGTFRRKMASIGVRWAISTPSVTVGQQLRTKHYGTVHTGLCEFAMASGDVVFVELVVTDQQ